METFEQNDTPPLDEKLSVFEGIEILGSDSFIKHTKVALAVLGNSYSFDEVRPYLARIKQSTRSGMRAYDDPPTFDVGEATWTESSIWYAGTIAHDAYHSLLFHKYKEENKGEEPHPDVWTGSGAEKKCLEFQLQVLQELLTEDGITDYLEIVKTNPTYQDIEERDW